MAIPRLIGEVQRLRRMQARSPRRSSSSSLASLGLLDAVPRIVPGYSRPVHLAPLVEELERSWAEPVRVTAHAPPRHAKTDTVLAFIALTLARRPDWTIAYVTYEDRTACSKSRRARLWAQAAGVQLADDANRLNEWRTHTGGGLLATGIGGPLTSQGVNILIVDDPYKNRVQAESRAYRSMIEDWWGDVADSRIEPGGSAFVFHTRWVPDDLVGWLHAGPDASRWRNVHMPAVSDDGRALWPERWPLEQLRAKETSAGPYTWASLYQGTPRPRGGAVFGDVHTCTAPPEGLRVAIGVDLAYTAKTSADWSVRLALGLKPGARGKDGKPEEPTLYVLDVVREQVKAPAFVDTLKKGRKQWPGARMRWYAAGPEQGVADLVRSFGVEMESPAPRGDKFLRAQPVAAAWNAGRVLVPASAPWASDFVAELASFTGTDGAHDDQVDALAAAYDLLVSRSGPALALAPDGCAAQSNSWAV